MISNLSSVLLVLVLGLHVTSAHEPSLSYHGPYLASHEQRFFNALDNVDNDFNAFMKVFAKNAYCEFSYGKQPDDVYVMSGPCHELFSNFDNLDQFKARWYPLTNTDPKHPERGVFSHVYVNYGLSNTGCEGLFFGFAEVKFNVEGLVIESRAHSTDMTDFMNCINGNQQRRNIQEEIYLAPHEKKVYDAFNHAHEDFDAFLDVFANAQCETIVGQAPKDITVMKGPCREEWRQYNDLIHTKERWMPVTNTHKKYPNKGVLAIKFWNYSLAEDGCEGLMGGTATISFNKNGEVAHLKAYLDSDDFMACHRGRVTAES